MRARVERGQTVVRAILLVAAIALIGVLLYRQVSRMTTDRVNVWVSSTELRPGQVVTQGLMKQIQAQAPKGAFVEGSAILGRVMKTTKPAGQPFYPADVEPRPIPPALASTIPSGRLLATVKVAALDLPTTELRTGDRLDIIQTGTRRDQVVKVVAHDAYMLGNLRSGRVPKERGTLMGVDLAPPDADRSVAAAEALVLAVLPEDVFPLAAAEASSQRMKLVLHSDSEVKSGKLLDPTPKKPTVRVLPAVEIIKGSKREKVYAADAVRKLAVAPPKATPPAPKAVASR